MLEDRLDLGTEDQAARQLCVVQRLDADPITGQEQLLPPSVPDRQGKHAVEALDASRPVLLVQMDDRLGIRARVKNVSAGLELEP